MDQIRRRVLRPILKNAQSAAVQFPTITQRTAQAGIASVDKGGHTVIQSASGLAAPIRRRRGQ